MDTNILTPQDIFIKVVRYEVPPFQRPYIWTQFDQWEPLWEDVSDIAAVLVENGNANRHFMGAIVLQQSFTSVRRIETRIVVDGQQRLTTCSCCSTRFRKSVSTMGTTNPQIV